MQRTNTLTWQTFLILLIGFSILAASIFFIMDSYEKLNRSALTPTHISNEIIRIVKINKNLKPDKVKASQKLFRHAGVWTFITEGTPQGVMPIYDINLNDIRAAIMKNPDNVELVFPLENNMFLHIKTHIVHSLGLELEFLAAFFLWLTALIGFCYYIARRVSLPLAQFIQGSNRFAQDINAPPLPETGSQITKAAFHAFNRMQSNLKQLLLNRTQMLAAISHDLRTPITRLKLRLENLPATEVANKMQQDLDRMESMIQSILSFAQDEFQHENVAKLDMVALCESICDDIKDMSLPVTMKESHEKITCMGRPLALRRAITNLITNGVKYGEKVSVELATQNKQLKIFINDAGPGIPETELEQVFLPFYRLDKSRQENTGGSGLGLATARDIIRSSGGDIELHNLPTGGLSAVIRLPLV